MKRPPPRRASRRRARCLRIAEAGGDVRWLYESGAIIDFLRNRFGKA
jgi:hypothetical protein